MKTAGIIAEYNPFHNGHKYHIEQTRRLTGADAIIAVMSGSFVQRGEYAICDKWSRAKMALLGGADLVVELPCVYSCQAAEYFAKGAVAILEAMNCDYISFGTEAENLEEIIKIAEFLKNPDEKFNNDLESRLKSGVSYPRAVSEALENDTVNTPNNVLAIEYLKNLVNMKPVAIKRRGSQHDGENSASDIRNRISNNENTDNLMPESNVEIMKNASFADNKTFESLVLYKLRTMTAEQLKTNPYVIEGLENRIAEHCHKCTTLEELLSSIKTKRYTMARIRRILTNALLDITREDVTQSPQYIRVLGANDIGAGVLARLRKTCRLPVITKVSKAPQSKMLEKDIHSTNIYSVLSGTKSMADYTTSPIIT